jgi:succinate dehydrogenase/fumarate reductase flavoprotein subunit
MTDLRCDVLVAGGGGAGLAAALSAAGRGADVLIAERSDRLGGTYAYSSGLIWIPANHYAAQDGIEDSVELARHHISHLDGGKSVPAVRDAYLERGDEALRFYESQGVPFEWIPGYPDYYAEQEGGLLEGRYVSSPVFDGATELPDEWRPRAEFSPYYTDIPVSWREIQSWGGYGRISDWDWDVIEDRKRRGAVGWGGATTGYLLAACLRAGVRFELGARLLAFEQRDGRVVGAKLSIDGDEVEVSAACGVVLATGGYDHNPEMQRQFDPHPPATPFTKPTVDGSGVQAAMNIGGSFASIIGQLMAPVYVIPPETPGEMEIVGNVAGREPSFPGSLVVNTDGKRFCDDSFYRSIVLAMSHFDPKPCRYPNLPAYLVFDEEWKRTYRLGYVRPGDVPEWMPRAEDARSLARQLGMSEDGLERTVADFNRAAATGDPGADEFGRGSMAWARNNGDSRITPNPCNRPLAGTLYAVELKLGTMGTLSGLAVDGEARVLRSDGTPIEGLYACGQSMAGLIEGYWYNSGTPNGRALIFGYIAANHALDTAPAREEAVLDARPLAY